MKVICVDDRNNSGLTYNKIYTVIGTYPTVKEGKNGGYYIIDDNGQKSGYLSSRFKDLSEERERKINKILDENI